VVEKYISGQKGCDEIEVVRGEGVSGEEGGGAAKLSVGHCSCQVSFASRRWLVSFLEETEGCTQGSYRRTEGGNSGENSRESSEGGCITRFYRCMTININFISAIIQI
jgi:hypothetical protein